MLAHTTLRWKYSVLFPPSLFRVKHSGHDFFVLLNNSTPSIAATTYRPIVPGCCNTRFRLTRLITLVRIPSTSPASVRVSTSRTVSTFGTRPLMTCFNRLSILSGAVNTVWKLSYCSISMTSTAITTSTWDICFFSRWSVSPLIFWGI